MASSGFSENKGLGGKCLGSRAHKAWSRSFSLSRAFHSGVNQLSESLEQPVLTRVVVDKEQVKRNINKLLWNISKSLRQVGTSTPETSLPATNTFRIFRSSPEKNNKIKTVAYVLQL